MESMGRRWSTCATQTAIHSCGSVEPLTLQAKHTESYVSCCVSLLCFDVVNVYKDVLSVAHLPTEVNLPKKNAKALNRIVAHHQLLPPFLVFFFLVTDSLSILVGLFFLSDFVS